MSANEPRERRKMIALVSSPNECLRGFMSGLITGGAIVALSSDHPHIFLAIGLLLLAAIPMLPIGYYIFSDVQEANHGG